MRPETKVPLHNHMILQRCAFFRRLQRLPFMTEACVNRPLWPAKLVNRGEDAQTCASFLFPTTITYYPCKLGFESLIPFNFMYKSLLTFGMYCHKLKM